MSEAVVIALGLTVGVDWRLLALVSAAVWAPLPAAVATGAVVIVGRRHLAARGAGGEIRFVESVVGELRAGASVRAALATACAPMPVCGPMIRRLEVGDPVAEAVAGLADALPRVGSLVEAAVQAGADGGRLVPVFEELVVHAVAEEEVAVEMRTATAQVRASMLVLVGGPVAYLAWSAGSGRLGELLGLPGGAVLASLGGALFTTGIVVMLLVARGIR